MDMRVKNMVAEERFVRGALGACLIGWALNDNPEGWLGLFYTATAILEYCPLRARLTPHSD